MNVKHCVSCAGCVRIFEKPLLYLSFKLNEDIEKGEQNFICDLKNKKVQNDIKNKWRDLVYREFYKNPDTFDTPDTRRSVSEKITVIYYLCRKTCEQFDSVHRSLLFT